MVERLLIRGKSSGALLPECFTSLMEASARFNEVEEESDEDGEEDIDDEDDDGDIEDDEVNYSVTLSFHSS